MDKIITTYNMFENKDILKYIDLIYVKETSLNLKDDLIYVKMIILLYIQMQFINIVIIIQNLNSMSLIII